MTAPDPQPMFINGHEARTTLEAVPVTDPSTGQVFASLSVATDEDVSRAIGAAARAFQTWRRVPTDERRAVLTAFVDAVERDRASLVALESQDVGKLVREVDRELTLSEAQIRSFSDIAGALFEESNGAPRTLWEPLGVLASLLPWNAPMSAIIRRIGITIATGNTTVIKPSTLGSMTPIRLTQLASAAGTPPGVINVVTGPGPTVGRRLAADPRVAKVAFTGGRDAGIQVMEEAVRSVRPFAVELGGKSPQIVFADADLESAVAAVLRGFTRNAGQICSCGTRLLLDERVADAFLADLIGRSEALRVGPADDPSSEMGPQISAEHRASIHGFVERARSGSGRVVAGGHHGEGDGFFYRPTIVRDVGPRDEVFREEVFGPVLAVTTFRDESEAIQLANDSPYGMVCGIWTTDLARGDRVSRGVEAGQCWINGYWATPVHLSRTAWKTSGIGAMDFGEDGLLEYLRRKQVM